jgi:hypothetical protein
MACRRSLAIDDVLTLFEDENPSGTVKLSNLDEGQLAAPAGFDDDILDRAGLTVSPNVKSPW